MTVSVSFCFQSMAICFQTGGYGNRFSAIKKMSPTLLPKPSTVARFAALVGTILGRIPCLIKMMKDTCDQVERGFDLISRPLSY